MAKKVLTKPTMSTTNISDLPDRPTISASALKAKFDKFGADDKPYTSALIDEIQSSAASGQSGSYGIGHNSANLASDNVGDALEEILTKAGTADGQNVKITGNQTINGVKTFNSSPAVPNPTSATQATNKGSVDVLLADKADKSDTYTKAQVDQKDTFIQGQIDTNKITMDNHIASSSAHGTNSIVNQSSVPGVKNTDALNNLQAQIQAAVIGPSNALIGVMPVTLMGSANAYIAAFNGATLQVGTKINATINITNTGSATINFNGSGAKTVKIIDLGGIKQNLKGGEMPLNSIQQFQFDGTDWILLKENVPGVPITVPLSFTPTTITKQGAEPSYLNATITPISYVNTIGASGNCESIAPFTASGCTLSLDTSKKVFGANALKITLTATTGTVSIPVGSTFNPLLYYLFSAYLDKGTATNITLQKDATGGGVLRSVTSTAVTPTRTGFMTQPSDNNAGNLIKLVVTGSIGQIAYVDGIMPNKISATNYADTLANNLARFQYADSIAVTKNPSVKVTHADGTVDQCYIDSDFLTGDEPKVVNGQPTGNKLWSSKKVLYGKDYAYTFNADFTGFKRLKLPTFELVGSALGLSLCNKYDGKILLETSSIDGVDQFGNNTTGFYVTVSDTNTGWTETINPSDDEVKAFMNGWKKTDASTWVSVVDGTTLPTTQSIDFVKSNIAPNYEGYQMYYKFAQPKPINKDSDSYLAKLVGDVPMLKQGGNTVEFGVGLNTDENANVAITTDATYAYINNTAYLQNPVDSFYNVKNNGIIDSNWTFVSAYGYRGNGYMRCPIANYDSKASYTVGYKEFNSPQIGSCSASYSEGLVDSVSALYEAMETKQQQSVVVDRLIDLASYEVINQARTNSWLESSGAIIIDLHVPMSLKNKDPLVTIGKIEAYCNGSQFTNYSFVGAYIINEHEVLLIYAVFDATLKSNIKTYGVQFIVNNIKLDATY